METSRMYIDGRVSILPFIKWSLQAAIPNDIRQHLLLFFKRPMEPCFMPKGKEKIAFNVPEKYYEDYYKSLEFCQDQVGEMRSKSRDVSSTAYFLEPKEITLPDLTVPKQLPRNAVFSLFLPTHQEMARHLIESFMGMPDVESLISACVHCQLFMNPFLFIYCLSVAILHRKDTKGFVIPTVAETFPSMFLDHGTLRNAQELNYVVSTSIEEHLVIDVMLPEPKIPEQRVAYFREDIGINSHHWHWHLIYPAAETEGVMVDKDRRGELFYYMHHQIMARYNTERLCNGLDRVKPFKDFHGIIAEGYFPKLNLSNAGRSWAPRFDNVALIDLDRPDAHSTVSELEVWRKNIMEAIDAMTIVDKDGNSIPLGEEDGIDILGNLVESTILSKNPDYYGNIHNQGHNLVALVHDPKGYHSESSSLMGTTETAMRDPFFYRWHAYIDDIFTTFKDKLTPYEPDKLAFPNISIKSIEIKGVDGAKATTTRTIITTTDTTITTMTDDSNSTTTKSKTTVEKNSSFRTMWERSVMNLANGLDFARQRKVYARLTYLQHEEFEYIIQVNNHTDDVQLGTVRIFMAPTLNENGTELSFEEQRMLMIEMDKFSHQLHPGENHICRRSTESSVTIPFERIFREESESDLFSEEARNNYYCECGWPQNMLLPRGTENGYPMVLFVMVSNWKKDRVDQELTGVCNNNASYCGLRDRKYPDRRAMGYPFDRRAPTAPTLEAFLQPNMAIQNCTIKFDNVIVDRHAKKH